MFWAKILNGLSMARMGRFDVEHSPEDDRIVVYVNDDQGNTIRVYINADGTTSSENVDRSTYDDEVDEGAQNTNEITIGEQWA